MTAGWLTFSQTIFISKFVNAMADRSYDSISGATFTGSSWIAINFILNFAII